MTVRKEPQSARNDPAGIPTGRRWLYRVLIAIGIPFGGLVVLELILRAVGFGHPASFFIETRIAGKSVLTQNPWFGLSFFPPALARSPTPVRIEAKKPPGTYRIFLFGESAALGDPRPAYGFGRYLEVLLRRRFPGRQFQVVCVAMTAVNSHAVLPIARECAHYQGDLWIIYMGNNEFIGPFGAETVFGPQAPPRAWVRAYLALEQTRVGQAAVTLARHLKKPDVAPSSWGGLSMFAGRQLSAKDPRRERVYRNFQLNLDDIIDAGVSAGAPILLSSMACNLKDCPPFGTVERTNSSSRQDWQALYQQGSSNFERGLFAEGRVSFKQALEMAPDDPELEFRLAQSFLSISNATSARESFAQARDLDTLPLRADRRLNQLIMQASQRYRGKGVVYFDAERALDTTGIPGNECFYEHVHLNPEGNYRLARALAGQVITLIPEAAAKSANAGWDDPEACARDLGLTDWNRYAAQEEILRRLSDAPYTNQLDHAKYVLEQRRKLRELKERLQPARYEAARQVYENALRPRPEDPWLHQNYAEFLTASGRQQEAAAQMQDVCRLIPEYYPAFLQLSRLLILQGRFNEALVSLQTAARLRPEMTDTYVELGQLYSRQGKLDEALKQYAFVQSLQPDNSGVRLLQAQILEHQKKRSEAIQCLREAIRLQPSLCDAHDLLGMELGLGGQLPEAESEFRKVVELRPDGAEGYLNLGITLARQGRDGEALEQFRSVLRLDPQNAKAAQFAAVLEQRAAGHAAAP